MMTSILDPGADFGGGGSDDNDSNLLDLAYSEGGEADDTSPAAERLFEEQYMLLRDAGRINDDGMYINLDKTRPPTDQIIVSS